MAAGQSYWISVDISPGVGMGVRMWAATGDEPEAAQIALENEDGYSILTQIDNIQLIVDPVANAGKSWFQKFYVEGHCIMQDYVSELEVLMTLRQHAEVNASTSGVTGQAYPTLPLPALVDSLLVAWHVGRSGAVGNVPSGFTGIPGNPTGYVLQSLEGNNGLIDIFTKVALGGEQTINMNQSDGTNNFACGVFEIPSGVLTDTTAMDGQPNTTHPVLTGLDGSDNPAIVIGVFQHGNSNDPGTPDAGWVEVFDNTATTPGWGVFGHPGPGVQVQYRAFTTGLPSYNPGFTKAGTERWAGMGVVVEST
jgi:hypothetical protein